MSLGLSSCAPSSLLFPEISLRAVLGVPTHVPRLLALVELLLAPAYNSLCRIEAKFEDLDTEKSLSGAKRSRFFVPQARIQLMPLENVQISELRTRILIFFVYCQFS